MDLLEREATLAALAAAVREAGEGAGRVVLIEGEAGIGKSAVLAAFAARRPPAVPMLWGACDPLQTPRPLGPLHDLALAAPDSELARALAVGADRSHVFTAFFGMLSARPVLVVFEDLHWADEATLDLVRFVSRRIARTRSMLVTTARDDELGPTHPLRLMLGDLASSGLKRLQLAPLSLDAVALLGGEADASTLHAVTGGNPFYVTEVLAAGASGIPATVRDAVLARAARLGASARAVLDVVAVAGPRVEPWLLADVAGAERGRIEDGLASGMLRLDGDAFVFRHELARQAVLESALPNRRQSLHRLVLQALQAPGAPPVDLARLAHHAEAAGDAAAVRELAPAAARRATALGAHRQAAGQFERALRHLGDDPAERAALLDEYAEACHAIARLDVAIETGREAAAIWRRLGEVERQAITLSRSATVLVLAGRNVEAEAAAREARAAIDGRPESLATVAVHRRAAALRMLDRDLDEAVDGARTTLALAERFGDTGSQLHALNTLGSALVLRGETEAGRAHLAESAALGERLGADMAVASALGNLGSAAGEVYRLDIAEPALRRSIAWAREHDLDVDQLYSMAWLSLVQVLRGQWEAAAASAHEVLADARSVGIARIMALLALGRLRARRGDPGAAEALDEGLRLAGATRTLQRLAPVHAARAEAAWLAGDVPGTRREAEACLELALQKRHAVFASELWYWRGLATAERAPLPAFCAGQAFALEAEGRWQEAASAWRSIGCPYETARSLAEGDEGAQREALAAFEALGAAPMVERVRRRLRMAGARGLPRGPRASTRANPQGLTDKELQVLGLVAQGLRNREIGERVSRSTRTVDHQLASIFVKLGVRTRAEAVDAAHRLGLVAR